MKFDLRGDIHGPWEHEFYGERWFDFDRAANELVDKLVIHPSAAQAQLRKLCAMGEIRAVGTDDAAEKPKSINQANGPTMICQDTKFWLATSTFTIGSVGNPRAENVWTEQEAFA
jgi:hypothetical protein